MNPLESFLLGLIPSEDVPLEFLSDSRLHPFFYSCTPSDHSAKAVFRPAFLAATARHALIKSHIVELIRAWNAVGIIPLMFKGFYLAEFVYDIPAKRFYGDVDILIKEEDALKAIQIAKEVLGWIELWNRNDSVNKNVHEESHLFTKDQSVRLDLHRFVLHNYTSLDRDAKLLTKQVWQDSKEITWEECQVRLPSESDSVLFGIVLSRMWDEAPGIKPHDILDLRAIRQFSGLSFEVLSSRAQEFGLGNVLDVYLERCNPWENVLSLKSLSKSDLRRWRRSFPSIWQLKWKYIELDRLARIIPVFFDVVDQFTNVLYIKNVLKKENDLQKIVQSIQKKSVKSKNTFVKMERITRGIHWILYILGPRINDSIPRSLAMYRALFSRGYPVEFVSKNQKVQHRTWLEYQGIPFEIFNAKK
jgi:hypothetical protein